MKNRVWLNGVDRHDDMLASMAWSVDPPEDLDKAGSAHLMIRDCNRQVDLDFDFCNIDSEDQEYSFSLDERIEKLDLMITELRTMRGELAKVRKARRAKRRRP